MIDKQTAINLGAAAVEKLWSTSGKYSSSFTIARTVIEAVWDDRPPSGESVTRDAAIESAAKKIYEVKGDRLGKEYIGWDKEPDEVKDDWRVDVRATIDAYEAARQF